MSRQYVDKGIRINRGQRRWRRYGSKILAACIAAAAIIAIIAIAAGIGKGNAKSGSDTAAGTSSAGSGSNVADSETSASEDAQKDSGSSLETENTSEKETSSGNSKGGALSGEPEEEEFTSGEYYDNAVFVGDMFVYGIDEYGYLDSSRLFSASFMTASKAMDLTEDISALKPAKIFVMLGFDDDNMSEDRTAQESADSIIALLQELKDNNPSANIYAVSEIPVSEEYESSGADYISQKDLDGINDLVKKGAEAAGIGYINVSDVLKDGDYLSMDYSNDGCHVKKDYYPFILNGIAETAK